MEVMLQVGLTAAQRLAIQKLIRAKSDREIARLLRKSHRLLNLHFRRRSGGSRSERWTAYELRLVGRIRDEELAKLLRRTPGAVAAKRESLDIPIFSPQRIRWCSREIELLGKRPDGVVARMLGRTRYAVQLKRHSLKIPQCWENRRAWMPVEDALLGTMKDAEFLWQLTRRRSEVATREVERRRRVGALGALGAVAQRRGPSLGRKPTATAAYFNGVRDERAI